MCQGVIFVWDSAKNEYHWGIGSHSALVEKVFKSQSARLYDHLVRVECVLGKGPGKFSIEGGYCEDDQKAVFKDKILDKVGTPQKLAKYVKDMEAEGFSFDDAFLNVLNAEGQSRHYDLTDREDDADYYRHVLTPKLRDIYNRIGDLESENGSDKDLELKMAIYLVVKKYYKKILEGAALDKAITNLMTKNAAAARKILLKRLTADIKKIAATDIGNPAAFSAGEVYVAVANSVQNTGELLESSNQVVRNFVGDGEDAFERLSGKEWTLARKMHTDYVANLRKKLPPHGKRVLLDADDAFIELVSEKKYLIREWAAVFEPAKAEAKKKVAAKKTVKRTAKKAGAKKKAVKK